MTIRHVFLFLCCLCGLASAGEFVVTGRLLGPDGRTPATGAVVKAEDLREHEDGAAASVAASARPGADGRFSLRLAVDESRNYAVSVEAADGHLFLGFSHVGKERDLGDLMLKRGRELHGRALGPDAKPLDGVRLTAGLRLLGCHHDKEAAAAVSGPDGAFVFADLSPGEYRISAAGNQYVNDECVAQVGDNLNVVTLRLQEGGRLDGQVLGPDGRPVAGAEVKVDQRHTTRSDARGQYLLGGLPAGEHRIKALAPGLAFLENRPRSVLAVPGKTLRQDLCLEACGNLDLTVRLLGVAAKDAPKDLRIALEAPDGGGYHDLSAPLSGGNALFRDIAPGAYTLKPGRALDGFTAAELPVTIKPGATAGALLTLDRGLVLRGRVLRGAAPLAGATVNLHRLTGGQVDWSGSKRATSGADGRFELGGLVAGRHEITVGHETTLELKRRLEVTAGLEEQVFALDAGLAVSGNVRDEYGKALAGIAVRLSQDGPGKEAQTGPDGAFALAGVQAGPSDLRIDEEGYEPFHRDLVVTGNLVLAEPLVLRKGATVSGRVSDAQAAPLSGIRVRLTWRSSGSNSKDVSTIADGTFRFAGVPDGAAEVAIEDEAWAPLTRAITVAGDTTLAEPLVLTRGFSVSGRVQDGQGQALAGVDVFLQFPGLARRATSDPDGAFTLKGLRAGNGTLGLQCEGYLRRELPFRVTRSQEVEAPFVLAKGLQVRGRVVDEAGRPVGGGQASCQSEDPRVLAAGTGYGSEQVGKDGVFLLKGLAPGAYRLQVQARAEDEGLPGERTIELQADLDLAEPLVLRRGLAVEGVVRDAEGRGVADLQVNMWSRTPGQQVHRQAETGGEGRFRLGGLLAGRYTLQVQTVEPGRGNRTLATLDEVAVPTDGALVVALARELAVAGTVTDGEGKPVARAQVICTPRQQERHGMQGDEGVTDAAGAFTLHAQEGAEYQLGVTAPGFLPHLSVLDLRGGRPPTPLKIALARGVTLSGVVLREPDGLPAAGLRVAMAGGFQGGFPRDDMPVLTDREGRFVLPGVPIGVVTIQVFRVKDEGAECLAARQVAVRAEGNPEVRLALPAAGAIRVQVLDAEGQGLEGCSVWAQPGRNELAARRGQTDAQGLVLLDEVPVGTSTVSFVNAGRPNAWERPPVTTKVQVAAGETAQVSFTDQDQDTTGPETAGTVRTAAGAAVGPGNIVFLPHATDTSRADVGEGLRQAAINADGSFRVKDLAAGPWVFRVDLVTGGEEQAAAAGRVEVRDVEAPLAIVLAAGRVAGVVQDGRGKPLAGSILSFTPADAGGLLGQMTTLGVSSTDDGTFALPFVAPGAYDVRVQHESGAAERRVQVTGDLAGLVFTVAAGVTVSGTVRDSAGQPVRDGWIVVLKEGGQATGGASCDPLDGSYRIRTLPAGPVTIFFHLEGHELAARDLVLDQDARLDVVLRLGGNLDIVLQARTPEARTGRLVTVRPEHGAPVRRLRDPALDERFAIRPTDAGGRTRVFGLAAGVYTVSVEGSAAAATVTVTALETAEARIDLDAPAAP